MRRELTLAGAIAALSVFIDFLLHYGLPDQVGGVTIAFRESPAYFASKFVFFFAIALAFILLRAMERVWGPLAYGLAASASFGAFYYYYPQVSVGSGSMPIALKVAWGGIHWGCGTIAAGVVMRKPLSALVGALILVASGAALVLVGPTLAAVAPSTGY